MLETFSERDIMIYQAGMCRARDIAQRTRKQNIADAIQRHITDNAMLFDQCVKNGTFNQLPAMEGDVRVSVSPHLTRNFTAGRTALISLAVFLCVMGLTWLADAPLQREDAAMQEQLTSVEFFNPVPDGADYYPPQEQ